LVVVDTPSKPQIEARRCDQDQGRHDLCRARRSPRAGQENF
jgi:hypothetical protein